MKSSAIWELSAALLLVLALYVLASSTRRTLVIGLLIVAIPFQFIETRFATSNVLLAYALAVILATHGGLKVRMLPELGLVALAYAASTALAGRELMTWQVVASVQFFSCLVVFLLAYNFAKSSNDERAIVSVLLITNALVLSYCALQLYVGPGQEFVPFGIKSLAFNSNRDASDPRLIGPFSTPGATAGYFTLMVIVCVAELIHARGRRRRIVQLIIALNVLGIVATGNRAAILVLLSVFPALMYVFRRELGPQRIAMFSLGGAIVLAVASAIAINYTGFGSMLGRLQTVTETENGVPQTRAETWPVAIEKIRHHPWFGEGPYFLTAEVAENMGVMRNQFDAAGETVTAYDPYPHSLYLYLLRTVGAVGLFAVLWYFVQTWRQLYRATRADRSGAYAPAVLRAGLVAIPAFLVAQITLEFNRYSTLDYAQFIFALMGLLVGLSDRVLEVSSVRSPSRVTTPLQAGQLSRETRLATRQ